ncbi:unnamed protein product [Cuscuta campestris]|uniref:MYB-CC type transcription factor LHEQLE-containing domain-containing protein n=1 Tax=Cuscuta campestris TaxID=132261 RepID=A0A484NA15_9ASTE|nr:unnamed protein product [Cuscuta campestris]
MRVMGVKGLTLYHLKSHLQKFRLGKQPHKEFNDHSSVKDVERASTLELQRNSASSSGMIGRNMNDSNVRINDAIRMQMEVQRRLHEQLEVQRHLQLRIEAQGKYMQTILEKACQTLSGGDTNNHVVGSTTSASGGPYKLAGNAGPHPSEFGFPTFQDLNIYGGDHLGLQQTIDGSSSLDGFLCNNGNNDNNLCLGPASRGKKRPGDGGGGGNGKNPMMSWSAADELGQPLLMTSPCGIGPPPHDDDDNNGGGPHMIQIAPLSLDTRGCNEIMIDDSVPEFYERKPSLNVSPPGAGGRDHGTVILGELENKFDPTLGRHSPRRGPPHPGMVMNMNMQAAAAAQGRRTSTFG